MGLNSIGKVQDTAVITLRHPKTGKPIPGPNAAPMSVTLYGPYSKHYKAAMRAQQQARLAEGREELTYEESEAMQVDLLVTCITDWSVALDTAALPCNPDTIRMVFDEHPWVRDQLLIAHGSAGHFLAVPKGR